MKLEGEYYTFVYGRMKYKIPIEFRDQVISHWQDNPNSDAEQWLRGIRETMRKQIIILEMNNVM